MTGRLLRIGLLVAVLVLLIFVASKLSFEQVKMPVPLRGEAARNPFYAAIRLSELLGAQGSWERVFTLPPANGVVFVSNWNWSVSRTRRERLQKWVEGGGRLVVDDSVTADIEQFESWSGINQLDHEPPDEDLEADEEDGEEAESADPPEMPVFGRPRSADCHALNEDGSGRQLKVCDLNWTHSLSSAQKILWALRDEHDIHAIRTAVGRGSVTVINATPFRFRDFLQGDHARLFVAAAQLRRGDVVYFLTEEARASLLSLLWRYGAPAVLLILAVVALALWRTSPRFGPRTAATESARRSLAEQIRGTGRFALRFGGGAALHQATLRALRDAAIHKFPGFDLMPASERVAALGKITGISADELGPAMNFTGSRNSHELRVAIAVLESARRHLLTIKKVRHGN